MRIEHVVTGKSCRGCGWKIVETVNAIGHTVVRRDYYCTVCDPNGVRENAALAGEGKPKRADLMDEE